MQSFLLSGPLAPPQSLSQVSKLGPRKMKGKQQHEEAKRPEARGRDVELQQDAPLPRDVSLQASKKHGS